MHKTNNVPNKQALELVNPQRLQPIKTMIQHIVSEVRMPGGTVLNNIPFTVKYDREAEHLSYMKAKVTQYNHLFYTTKWK